MMPFSELVLASHNAGKLKGTRAMLGDAVRVRSVAEFSTVEPEETGLSFIENAILKARNAARISGLPAWPMTRAWRSTPRAAHRVSTRRATPMARATQPTMPSCCRYCATSRTPSAARSSSVRWPGAARRRSAADHLRGLWHGRILHAPRGEHGFGYDPLFWVPECDCSSAELPAAQKNQLSHRARAMALLKQRLGI